MFPLGLAELCGRAAGQRGATMSYTRILSPAEQILRTNGMFEEEQLLCSPATNPERPFAFEYDFLEIFSGASLVTGVLAAKGIVVGPPLDIGISAESNRSSTDAISCRKSCFGDHGDHLQLLSQALARLEVGKGFGLCRRGQM